MSDTQQVIGVSEIKSKSTRVQLMQLCAEVRAISERALEDGKIKKALMEQVGQLLEAQGLKKVDGEDAGWMASQVSRTTRKISGKLLSKLGVKVSVIEAATEEKVSEYWTVTAKKGGAEEEES